MANNFENPEVFMEVAKAAAGHYTDSYAVKLLAFSENATYLVYDPATDEKLFVLRVGRPGYHTREEYESEISWLRQINDYTPLKVANPIPASDGSYIQEIEKDKVTYFCIATEFLTGETLEHDNSPEAAPAHFRTLGETTAYLHRQTEIWNGTKDIKRFHWDYENMIGENRALLPDHQGTIGPLRQNRSELWRDPCRLARHQYLGRWRCNQGYRL